MAHDSFSILSFNKKWCKCDNKYMVHKVGDMYTTFKNVDQTQKIKEKKKGGLNYFDLRFISEWLCNRYN